MSVRVVVPSRKRAGHVEALRVFPDATLCVGEDETHDYAAAYPGSTVVTHPADVTGIGPLRQWVLDNFDDERLLMADDDVRNCAGQWMGFQRRYGPAEAVSVVESAAACAADAGASVFGFNQAWDTRKFHPLQPFAVRGWVGGVIGFVGRKHKYDTKLLLQADIDFCLTCMRHDRVIWTDLRYSFTHRRFVGSGGNAVHRSQKQHEKEIAYLKAKWGNWLSVRKTKTTTRLIVNVER